MGFALLTVAAVLTQLVSLIGTSTFDPVNYFTYFTIDSNLIALALLVIGAARWRSSRSPTLDLMRGGAVVYMTVTGAVFTLLLRNTDVDTAIPWVNSVVHEVMPMVIIADWLIDPPQRRPSFRQGILWLSFPLVWIAFELIRGAISGRYHYPFLNPVNGGYASVATYSVVILLLMLVVCAVVVWLARARGHADPA
jgi:hypothetical protein